MKRDLSQAQLEYRLRKAGWIQQIGLGYWEGPRSKIHISIWNYHRRRDAYREMQKLDAKYATKVYATKVSAK